MNGEMYELLPPSIRIADVAAYARSCNASDVHLTVGMPPILRVDGELEKSAHAPLDPAELHDLARGLLGEEGFARLHGAGDITGTFGDPRAGRMRVHVYAAGRVPAIAIRLLHRTVPTLESLDVPPAIAAFARERHGLLIFAGPTGSGKSTTMAAFVDRINEDAARRILTVEDPVEYRYESRRSLVTQREVGHDTPSFAAALRGALRADPDVIVVGEMRDQETMAGALAAAQTGHLVISTLHTGSTPQSVDRIADAFAEAMRHDIRAQLANALVGIVCQQLLRKAAARGRRAAFEILVATDAVRALVRDAKTHQLKNLMATGSRAGMQTLEQHLESLVRDREIEPAEARRFGLGDLCVSVA